MGFEHIRVSKAGAHARRLQSRAESTCLTGGFYKTPTANQKIDALYPLNITWDTSCLTPANDKADIYLYAPGLATPRLHLWSGVTFSSGSYNATLKPRWWNSTSSEQLQLLIIQHGDAPFLATLPGGPSFTATYQAPSSGAVPDVADVSKASADAGITNVDAKPEPASSHRGKIAAAVLLPLLALIALGVFAYLKLSRAKGKEKRRNYAEAVDKRMSTISADWKSMSAAGAQAAIRNSIAVNSEANPRASSFSFGAIRPPSSVYPSDGHGHAGVGVPEMSQYSRSPGVGLRSSVHSNALAAARVSRVSFADSPNPRPRPSGESRRSVYERRSQVGQSRAFHFSGEDEPPLPEGAAERASMFVGGINPALVRAGNTNPSLAGLTRLNTSTTTVNTSRLSRFDEVYGEEDGDDQARVDSMYASYGAYAYSGQEDEVASGVMSPSQTNGPHALTEEDVGPALSMIRAHDEENGRLPSFPTPVHYEYSQTSPGTSNWTGRDETLFTASPITPGFPMNGTAPLSFAQAMSRTASNDSSSAAEPASPIVSGMMAPPVQGMSPDDMLRMYAERRATGAGSRTTTPSNDMTPPARALSPSAPGTFSPTRGAYGVSGFDE